MANNKVPFDNLPKPPPSPIDEHIHHHHEEYQLRTALAGGAAAAVTRVFVQPFDVLKIRFQLQVEPFSNFQVASGKFGPNAGTKNSGKSTSKYTSLTQAIRLIAKEEGASAFWKGHTPAQGLSIVYGVVQFWGYEQLKGKAKHWQLHSEHKNTSNFVCGGLAGALGTVVTAPLDVIRTRLIAQDNKRGYSNTFHAGVQIFRTEGVRGVYRGLLPGIMQITPLTGINFMFYNMFCATTVDLLKLKSKHEIPAVVTLFNGAFSGLLAKSLVYPLDLSKKRLQIQGFSEHRRSYGTHFECHGTMSCLRATIRQEGFLGLYKGMVPSIWKAGLTSALNFCIYDNIVGLTFSVSK